jgi:hypothetical protein
LLVVALGLGLGCNKGSAVIGVPNICIVLDGSFDDGTLNPENDCQICNYMGNPITWTPLADGTACSAGICINQLCQPGCILDSGIVPAGPDPDDSCRSCRPGTTMTDWVYLPDMTHCNPDGGAGAFCLGGFCNGCLSATEVCSNGAPCCSRLCDGQRCYSQRQGGPCADDRSCSADNRCQQGVCCSPLAGSTCQPQSQGSWCCADAGLQCVVNTGSSIGICQMVF